MTAPSVITTPRNATPKNTTVGGPVAGLTVASPMARLAIGQPDPAQEQPRDQPEYAASTPATLAAQRQASGQTTLVTPGPRSLSGPATLTASRSVLKSSKPSKPATAEQRWRAAVKEVPLESPRPFPTSMRPLVAQLAGSAERVSYTTGPATSRALAEVGALGATTGTTVHLTRQPSADPASMGVLAHELTHARSPISRPRFMLRSPTGSMDSDERHARTVGSSLVGGSPVGNSFVGSSFVGTSASIDTVAPMRVQRLFGGLPKPSNLVSGATGAVGALGNQATGAVSGLADSATSEISNQAERFSSAASGLRDRVTEEAGAVSAGLVDQLPVGGGANGVVGAVSQMARTVVQNAVREATTTTMDEANRAAGQAGQAVQGLRDMATDGVNSAAGQAGQWVDGAMAQAGDAVRDVGGQVGAAGNAVSEGASGLLDKATSAVGPGAAQAPAGPDLDRIVEALEERLLRQLERRGGRYAGVF
jgi:hypothetical protein